VAHKISPGSDFCFSPVLDSQGDKSQILFLDMAEPVHRTTRPGFGPISAQAGEWDNSALKMDQTLTDLASATSSRLVFIDEVAEAIGSAGRMAADSETVESR
jgi:hypothetical protein